MLPRRNRRHPLLILTIMPTSRFETRGRSVLYGLEGAGGGVHDVAADYDVGWH